MMFLVKNRREGVDPVGAIGKAVRDIGREHTLWEEAGGTGVTQLSLRCDPFKRYLLYIRALAGMFKRDCTNISTLIHI